MFGFGTSRSARLYVALEDTPMTSLAWSFPRVTSMLHQATLEANQIVLILNIIYTEFDKLIDKFADGDRLRKVETVGAEYMVVGGAPERTSSHARAEGQAAAVLI